MIRANKTAIAVRTMVSAITKENREEPLAGVVDELAGGVVLCAEVAGYVGLDVGVDTGLGEEPCRRPKLMEGIEPSWLE